MTSLCPFALCGHEDTFDHAMDCLFSNVKLTCNDKNNEFAIADFLVKLNRERVKDHRWPLFWVDHPSLPIPLIKRYFPTRYLGYRNVVIFRYPAMVFPVQDLPGCHRYHLVINYLFSLTLNWVNYVFLILSI